MVEFQVIASENIEYGNRNFIEIALKKVEGQNEFVSISKGYIDPAGNKRFRTGLGVGLEIADEVAEKIKEMASAASPKEESSSESEEAASEVEEQAAEPVEKEE